MTAGFGHAMADMLEGVQEVVGEVLGGHGGHHGTKCHRRAERSDDWREDTRWDDDECGCPDSWRDDSDDDQECRPCDRREHCRHHPCRCHGHRPRCGCRPPRRCRCHSCCDDRCCRERCRCGDGHGHPHGGGRHHRDTEPCGECD
ncbi:hypothetical protein [Streptomyces sp. NPDC003077]|uniref:hypothetical protein n=1 Tax=Streptomyces sp. NPDC003077 TaxID=3154443 RepID=UPI0033BC5E9C